MQYFLQEEIHEVFAYKFMGPELFWANALLLPHFAPPPPPLPSHFHSNPPYPHLFTAVISEAYQESIPPNINAAPPNLN